MRLNHRQEEAVGLVIAGHNVLITGAIGTGKTATISACIDALKRAGLRVAATASTGLASQNIKGSSSCCLFICLL